MKSTRTVLVSVLIVVGTAACGSDEQSADTTTTAVSTTTSSTVAATTTTTSAPIATVVQPTSTDAPTTTVAPTTVVTAPPTTVAPGASLKLGASSLGAAEFGTDPEAVITYVASVLGPPTADSGWTDAITGGFGVCPGNEVRGVAWNDLVLLFSDNTDVASGRRHFFSYTLGPAFEADVNPFGLTTDAGIGIGSTVANLRGTYPAALISPADDVGSASFLIFAGLSGALSSDADDGQITVVRGGTGCGE
jgi:hypothetical protein